MLFIQDPSYYEDSILLHESLVGECKGSVQGAGAYAYATKDGVSLFMADENFKEFIKSGTFCLVVGTDDVTNEAAINQMIEFKHKYGENLTIYAYLHKSEKSIFHPKYSWFQKQDGGSLVIGSGNLTPSGLRRNREAYSVLRCDDTEMQTVISEWEKWLEHSKPFLLDIEDPIVMEKAGQNTISARMAYSAKAYATKTYAGEENKKLQELYKNQPQNKKDKNGYASKATDINTQSKMEANADGDQFIIDPLVSALEEIVKQEELDTDISFWDIDLKDQVLIAEVPKNTGTTAKDRTSQINFSKENFENFFGATCGENGQYRILLRNIEQDHKELGEIECRPSVSSASHNYRLEFNGAKNLAYPNGDRRPIIVVVKISPREFLYEFFMPDGACYDDIENLLPEKKGESQRMRRITTTVKDIYVKTKEVALWRRLRTKE